MNDISTTKDKLSSGLKNASTSLAKNYKFIIILVIAAFFIAAAYYVFKNYACLWTKSPSYTLWNITFIICNFENSFCCSIHPQ